MTGPVNRRQFMGAAAGLAIGSLVGPRLGLGAAEADWAPSLPTPKLYKVFVGRTGGIYMSRPKAEIEKFNNYLAGLEKKLNVQFVGGDLIPPAKTAEVAAKLEKADGAILFHLSGHGGGAPVLGKLVEVGIPTAVFSQPFSGHGWMFFPAWQKAGHKVVLLPSSDWTELERISALMRVPAWMRHTRLLRVGRPNGTAAACDPKKVNGRLGTEVISIPNTVVMGAHQAVPIEEARAEAEDYWISKAKKIVEPTKDEIVNSARLYLAMRNLMKQHGARATASSHCMGRPAKCCLTYSKLNDLGLVGACEGDADSTLTMLLFAYAFGIPGFISDPVFDTSQNALIHFHCTCATKMDGPGGKRLPFTIRTQSDSNRGVSLEVEQRIGQVVTCAKFVNLDTMLISRGEIFKITHDELGCRTQFWTRVRDARAFFMNWGGGVLKGGVMTLLHRDVFYGDHINDIRHLGTLMGFKVIEEG